MFAVCAIAAAATCLTGGPTRCLFPRNTRNCPRQLTTPRSCASVARMKPARCHGHSDRRTDGATSGEALPGWPNMLRSRSASPNGPGRKPRANSVPNGSYKALRWHFWLPNLMPLPPPIAPLRRLDYRRASTASRLARQGRPWATGNPALRAIRAVSSWTVVPTWR